MRGVASQLAAVAQQRGVPVVVHGSDATDNPELFLRLGANFVLRGEAEQTLVELCSALLAGKPVGDLPGLVHISDHGEIVHSSKASSRNEAWSELPQPAQELTDFAPYRNAWIEAHGQFSVNMVASRGCPYRCNWCAKPISGNRFQLRPAPVVAQEMSELKEKAEAEHIWFSDDVFALNRHWVEEFAEEVVRRDAALPFKIQSRADLMTETTVAALKTAGCAEVWMGVESGSQKILDAMDKGLHLSTVCLATSRLRAAGIRVCYFLQLGYPGEEWTDLEQTIEFVRASRPDDVGISFSYPLPGTVFYERVHAQLGPKRNWKDSDDLCIMFQAKYTSTFYRAVRDALHAEVDSWKHQGRCPETTQASIEAAWQRVFALEPVSRNAHATPPFSVHTSSGRSADVITIQPLTATGT
jgi:radical SAM superfamily enzyme YgiQ (UPF0313 family)